MIRGTDLLIFSLPHEVKSEAIFVCVGKQIWGCTMKRPEVEVAFFYQPPTQFLRQHFSLNLEHSSWLD